jgi:4,5-DOPA dioxygenase extradiol
MPALFISHGSPMLAVSDSPARRFLQQLGSELPRPSAVVVWSAHYDTPRTEVTGAAHPETIHDFGGFPRELYELRYPAPGDPELAARCVEQLATVGITARVDRRRGFDHGAWIPLKLMYAAADVRVVQLSIDSGGEPEHHWIMGQALRPLRDAGVLLIGSGGATHNLGLYFRAGNGEIPPSWVSEFNDWVAEVMQDRRFDDLKRYREVAPYAEQNHPSPEHFLPIFAAAGASFEEEPAVRIHHSYDRGLLSLDAYAFGFDGAPSQYKQ